jgi:hypothetical protein
MQSVFSRLRGIFIKPTTDSLPPDYKKRREDAVAFWRSIPSNTIMMGDWRLCLIGQLAKNKFDGWDFSKIRGSYLPARGKKIGSQAAAIYFAITLDDACECFIGRINTDLEETFSHLLACKEIVHV